MLEREFTCVRLSDPYMTGLIPPFNRIVHHLMVTQSAAYGCLKPIPVDRLRRAYLHHKYNIAISRFLGTLNRIGKVASI